MYNAPYAGVANELAKFGRYGDSELVHLNPIEVQMLASLSPTGQLTINPMTGQKEAFLPFLAPLLGSFLGSSLLTGAGAGLLGAAGLSSAAAGAIGSGLATTAVTGDLEQGILSGITGFGLGQAFGAAGDALSKTGANAATQGATQAATGTADVLGKGFQITPEGLTGQGLPSSITPETMINAPASQFTGSLANAPSALTGMPTVASQAGGMGSAIQSPGAPPLSATQRMSAPFQEPGAFMNQLSSPSSFLPMYVGETGRMARAAEIGGEGSAREYEESQEKERQRIRGQMGDVFGAIRTAYPGVGYAQGGYIDRYYDGGSIEDQVREAMNRSALNSIPEAKDVQLSLRGQYARTPPRASYSALDVGGEGYMPGMAPEFRYFTDVDPNKPPVESGPPAGVAPGAGSPGTGGDIAGSPEFNLEDFLGNFGGYRRFFGNQGQTAPIETPETPESPEDTIMYPGGTKDFDFSGGRRGEDSLENFPIITSPGGGEMPETPEMPGDIRERLGQVQTHEFAPFPMPGMEQPPVVSPEVRRAVQPSLEPAGPPPQPIAEAFDPGMFGARPSPRMEQEPAEAMIPSGIASLGATNPFTGMPDIQMPAPQMPAPQMPPAMQAPPQMAEPPPQMAVQPPPEMSSPEPSFQDMDRGMARRFRGMDYEMPESIAPEMASPQLPAPEMASAVEAYQAPVYEIPSYNLPSVYDEYGLNDLSFADMGLFAEGGMTEVNAPPSDAGNQLVEMTVAAIRGEVENADQIINAFIQQYGPELFMDLRERVLQDIIPGAQTQGMIEGEGGGQDDLVEGMIGTQRPVAVSPGEYIIPADVVSLAGGGYSGDGAKYFDGLVDDIRQKTMGTTEQIKPYRSA
jgi:hypothetical protein